MYIRGFHIDGFGIFHNQGVSEIPTGLTLFVGENESGKTTLMEFFRTVLFGIRSRVKNDYPPLRGGSHGGRLRIALKDGREFSVERQGKRVTIAEEGGATFQEEPSQQLLGGLDRQTFENVFSIGLEELQGLDVLSQEAVRGRLLSAGTGLGSASVPETFKSLDKELDELLTPRGRKQVIVSLMNRMRNVEGDLRKVRDQSTEYARLQETKIKLEGRIVSTKTDSDKTKARLEQIKKLETARESWVRLLDARTNIIEFDHAKDFPANGLERLEALKTDIDEVDREKIEADEKVRQLKDLLEDLVSDNTILKHRNPIESLSGEREKFATALHDLPERKSDERRDLELFQQRLSDRGKDWTSERLAQIDLSVSVRQHVQHNAYELQSAESISRQTQARLLALQDQELPPSLPLGIAIAAVSLGLILAVLSLFQEAYVTAIAVMIAAIVMSGFLYRYRQRQEANRYDGKKRCVKVAEEADLAEDTSREIRENWQDWLRKQGFEDSIRPEGFDVILQVVETARTAEQNYEKSRERRRIIENYVDDARFRIVALSRSCGRSLDSTDPGVEAIDTLSETLDEARAVEEQRKKFTTELTGIENAAKRLGGQFSKKESELLSLIQSAGIQEESDFRNRAEANRLYQQWDNQIHENSLKLQTIAGAPDACSKLEAELNENDPEQLASETMKLETRLREIEESVTHDDREIGRTNQRLTDMSHDQRLSELLLEHRSLQQQLHDALQRWATLALCRLLLEKARDVYERERQPRVIQEADKFLQTLVGGRYRIISSLDEHGIQLEERETIRRKSEGTWSRGLGDQVYLATRMGLAREFGCHSEPLPLFLDDILVRFDPRRRQAAARLILEFASEQQVLMFSCRPEFAEIVFETNQEQSSNEIPVSFWQLSDNNISQLEFDT